MEAKYCPRAHPVKEKWVGGQSHTWKRLLDARKDCEKFIIWKVATGNLSFWWDNWVGIGPLAKFFRHNYKSKKVLEIRFSGY